MILFGLNNDNSVEWTFISISGGDDKSIMHAGDILGIIYLIIGLNQSEILSLTKELATQLYNGENSVYKYHTRFEVWCSKTGRYIQMKIQFDNHKRMNWIFLAYQ